MLGEVGITVWINPSFVYSIMHIDYHRFLLKFYSVLHHYFINMLEYIKSVFLLIWFSNMPNYYFMIRKHMGALTAGEFRPWIFR